MMSEILDQASSLDSPENLSELLASMQGKNSQIRFVEDLEIAACEEQVACQICSNEINAGISGWAYFSNESSQFRLPVHQECHDSRSELSSEAVVISLRIGHWMLSRILSFEGKPAWLSEMISSFIDQRGKMIGQLVVGSGVSWWDRNEGIQDPIDLVRFARHLYIYERENPKFMGLGGQVPEWDEVNVSWHDYKRLKPPGPFYLELRRLQKQKGKPKRGYHDIRQISERTGGLCALCGAPGLERVDGADNPLAFAGDHIVPLCKGGSNELENFQPLHDYCNKAKNSLSGGHIVLALIMGRWFVDRYSSLVACDWWKPAGVQVVRHLSKGS